eukprot:9282885-Alexandrium_andersonii.AAC.1
MDVDILEPRTPPDAMAYFKNLGNKLNLVGSQSSFMEKYNAIEAVEQAWRAHRLEMKKSQTDTADDAAAATSCSKRSQAGYEKEYA